MKRLASLLLILALTLSAFSVLADTTAPSCAIVVAGTLGDRSFYDSANAGLELLKKELNLDGKVIECGEDGSKFESSLIAAAETSDVVIAVGWQFYDALQTVAPGFEDKRFIFIDNDIRDIPNLMSILYAQNEGSFLVGYIAGKMTKTGKVGVVGGQDGVVINDFIVGYEAGAKHANADIQVIRKYTETFENPSKGKEAALALYDEGCDIVFAVAGKTGEGVFEAAAERKCYAIGVDSDQKYINPDVILCSCIKEVGKSIYSTVSSLEKNFKGGEAWLANTASGYISVGYGDDTMPQQVSDELKAEVEQLRTDIVNGNITVPTTLK